MALTNKKNASILAAVFLCGAMGTASSASVMPVFRSPVIFVSPPRYQGGGHEQTKEIKKENKFVRDDVTAIIFQPSHDRARDMAKSVKDDVQRGTLANIYWACAIDTKREFNVTELRGIQNYVRSAYRECVESETKAQWPDQTPAM